jgi:peptide/nickel transport system ATP-binding protein
MADVAPLVVDGLQIHDLSGRPIVNGVSFTARAGEVFALIGESGSGKTSVALSLLGFARPGMKISAGQVSIDGSNLLRFANTKLRHYRGAVVSIVPQNPAAAFSPRMPIGLQMSELLRAHGYLRRATKSLIEEALKNVDLPVRTQFLGRYPFELSGGQLQRVAIAMAFITNPKVIVMDEPTTGLDVSTQRTILELIRGLVGTSRACFIYVTHDLAVVDMLADRVAVMRGGEIVEMGYRKDVFGSPGHDYTRVLLNSAPHLPAHQPSNVAARCTTENRDSSRERAETLTSPRDGCTADNSRPLIDVKDLHAFHGRVEVVHGISLSISKGQCMGLVGGSGSGKTTTGRCIAGLHKNAFGNLMFEGRTLPWTVAGRTRTDLCSMQIVFQNPDRSLNPRESIGRCLSRAVRLVSRVGAGEADAEARRLLKRVRLPERTLHLYPDDLSGGERQRVAIARALATKPKLLICDEVTSSLDVSVQAAVVELLVELKTAGLSMLFITHNLPLVSEMAETIVIMKNGEMVETGKTDDVLSAPEHEYTKMLLAAAPAPRLGD